MQSPLRKVLIEKCVFLVTHSVDYSRNQDVTGSRVVIDHILSCWETSDTRFNFIARSSCFRHFREVWKRAGNRFHNPISAFNAPRTLRHVKPDIVQVSLRKVRNPNLFQLVPIFDFSAIRRFRPRALTLSDSSLISPASYSLNSPRPMASKPSRTSRRSDSRR